MIRVADYIAQSLVAHGITDVFLVTGGGAMHLNDAIGRCEGLNWVACHHEQACSMAAQGYFRLTNRLAAVNVTTGPGGTNAITGVFGGWVDSLGMVVVSGQVKWETLVRSTGLPLRQLGDQEVDIVKLVAPITKYAVMVTDPQSVRFHLEKAIHLARSGRPGPVWLDVPMNVQGAMIDPGTLPGYDPSTDDSDAPDAHPIRGDELRARVAELRAHLASAERPVIYAGSGVRFAGAERELLELAERMQVPVVTNFNAHDLIASDHPLFAGRPGTIGDRAGNFAVQNADFVLVIGSRLNIRQLSYAWEHFARAATVAMVDVDAAELDKPTLSIDLKVHADAGDVLRGLLAEPSAPNEPARRAEWVQWCQERVERYPVVSPTPAPADTKVDPYRFGRALFDRLNESDVVVTGDATACITTFQSAHITEGQRLFSDSGCAPMGFDLPASIGAAVGAKGQRVICMAGDGSIMMNLQELQTIRGYGLPVKIFLYNNRGYHSIRQTQNNFFPGNPVGHGPDSGVTFPDFERIAYGFDLPYRRCENHAQMGSAIEWALSTDGPTFCEVLIDESIPFMPKTSSKRLPDGRMVTAPLEDMAPFLSREELRANMLVPLASEDPHG